MSITSGSDLTLGVLFKGRVDQAFQKATGDLRRILDKVSGSAKKVEVHFKGVSGAARKTSRDMQGVGKHAMKTAQGFQRLANSMKFIAAYGVAARVIWGTANAIKAGAKAIVDYDQVLKNLQAITSATDIEISALGDTIQYVASTTKFSATEVGEAAILLGQAGFTAGESLDAMNAVANLATGTLSSMSSSADLLTTAVRAFSLQARDSNRITDVFASAVNRSKLTVDKLRIAFNYLGPISNQVGLSIEETAAGAMLLANAGLRASTVGTGFRRVLQQLVKPSKKMRVLIEGMGLDLDKLNPATNSLSKVMSELQKVLGKNVSQAERARRAFELFGLRGAAVASAFAQAGAEGFDKMYNEVLRVGTASEMAEKQMEGLGVMIKNTMDKLQNLAIAIGEGGIADAFRTVIIPLRDFIDLLTRMVKNDVSKAIIAVGTLTTSILGLRIAFKFLTVAIGAFALGRPISVIKRYAASFGMLALSARTAGVAISSLWKIIIGGPFGWILTISSIAVALVSFRKSAEEVVPALKKAELQQRRVVDSLIYFKETLAKTKQGTNEYRSVLERLASEFPELSDSIDLLSAKFKDGGQSFDQFINEKRIQVVIRMSEALDKMMEEVVKWEEAVGKQEGLIESKSRQKGLFTLSSDQKEGMQKQLDVITKVTREKLSGVNKEWRRFAIETLSLTEGVYSSYANLTEFFQKEMGKSPEMAEKYAKEVLKHYDQIKLSNKQMIASSAGYSEQLRKMMNSQEALLKQYSRKEEGIDWLELFDTLGEDDQIELIKALSEMKDKIKKMREKYKESFTPEQLASEELRIIKETYKEFAELETNKQKTARTSAQKILAVWKQLYQDSQSAELQAVDNWYANEEQKIKGSVYYADAHVKLVEAAEAKKAAIRNKYAEEDSTKRKEYQDLLDNFAQEEVDLQLNALDQWKEVQRSRLALAKQYADEELRTGKISIDEYHAYLKAAEDAGVLTVQEASEKKRQTNKNFLQSLKEGWEAALREVKTLSELMYNIGEEASGRFAGGLTDSIWDFIDGTKSAKDAMKDFAKDMLEWLAKLILQWTILKALQGISGMGTGNNAFVSSMMSAVGGSIAMHGGGIVGKEASFAKFVDSRIFKNAPRFHDGLIPGEIPAILKKGEGVFTPEQMKAMGGRQVVFNSNVTVNVNSDSGGQANNDPAKNEVLGRDLSRVINEKVNQNIQNQLRPGGIIDQHLRSR